MISFRWRQFNLKDFDGRDEFGTLPWWYRIGWVMLLPALLVYGWIRQGLDDAGVTAKRSTKKDAPGTVYVAGTKKSRAATELIDKIKRSPRNLWVVFSHTQLAIVKQKSGKAQPIVIWKSDESARPKFNPAMPNSIELRWDDGSRAALYPTADERKLVTRFVRATWEDQGHKR